MIRRIHIVGVLILRSLEIIVGGGWYPAPTLLTILASFIAMGVALIAGIAVTHAAVGLARQRVTRALIHHQIEAPANGYLRMYLHKDVKP